MAGIYIYSDKAELAAELIGFAKSIDKEAVLFTPDKQTAIQLKSAGADRIMLISGGSDLVENYAKDIAGVLKDYEAELFAVGATPRGRDLAARVAGHLGCAMVSDVVSLSYNDGHFCADRMMYGGAVQVTELLQGLGIVTVPAGKFETITGPAADIIPVELSADTRVTLTGTTAIEKKGVDLENAEKVVCIGMSMESYKDLQIALDLADQIGAEVGCTRGIAEERKWLPLEQYIGISGAVIRPKLYISMGVSGQIQHVYGIRDAQIIVAVDSNEKAPIFKAADYGIVGDMYEVIPALTTALSR